MSKTTHPAERVIAHFCSLYGISDAQRQKMLGPENERSQRLRWLLHVFSTIDRLTSGHVGDAKTILHFAYPKLDGATLLDALCGEMGTLRKAHQFVMYDLARPK